MPYTTFDNNSGKYEVTETNVSQEKQLSEEVKKILEGLVWWLVGFPLFLGWVCLFLSSVGVLVYQTSRWLKSGSWTEIPVSTFLPLNDKLIISMDGWLGGEFLHLEAWIVLLLTSLITYYGVHFLYRLLSDWWHHYR